MSIEFYSTKDGRIFAEWHNQSSVPSEGEIVIVGSSNTRYTVQRRVWYKDIVHIYVTQSD
jgi:hypothetical protein